VKKLEKVKKLRKAHKIPCFKRSIPKKELLVLLNEEISRKKKMKKSRK